MNRRDLLKIAALAPLFPLLPKEKKEEKIQLEHFIEPYVPKERRLITGEIAINFLGVCALCSQDIAIARAVESALDSGKAVYLYSMKLDEKQIEGLRSIISDWREISIQEELILRRQIDVFRKYAMPLVKRTFS